MEIRKKIEEIQMEITSSPEWKLFSLRNVLISFERKHWEKAMEVNISNVRHFARTKTRLPPLLDGFLLRHTAIGTNPKSQQI